MATDNSSLLIIFLFWRWRKSCKVGCVTCGTWVRDRKSQLWIFDYILLFFKSWYLFFTLFWVTFPSKWMHTYESNENWILHIRSYEGRLYVHTICFVYVLCLTFRLRMKRSVKIFFHLLVEFWVLAKKIQSVSGHKTIQRSQISSEFICTEKNHTKWEMKTFLIVTWWNSKSIVQIWWCFCAMFTDESNPNLQCVTYVWLKLHFNADCRFQFQSSWILHLSVSRGTKVFILW